MKVVATATVPARVAPENIWQQLIDVGRWREWNHDLAWAAAEGAFVPGGYVTLKPVRGRQTAYRIEAVVAPRLLELALTFGPVAALRIRWTIHAVDGTTAVEQSLEIGGPLAPLLVAAMAARMASTMQSNLERLAGAPGEAQAL